MKTIVELIIVVAGWLLWNWGYIAVDAHLPNSVNEIFFFAVFFLCVNGFLLWNIAYYRLILWVFGTKQ